MRYVLLSCMLLYMGLAHAQNISSAEFFFDNDPGIGNGTALSVNANTGQLTQTFSIPTTGLSEGFHSFYVRTQSSSGSWGLYDRVSFYIVSLASLDQPINAAEYFFDSDPGVGNGTSLALNSNSGTLEQSFVIPTTSLSNGFHGFYIRTRNTDGNWSLYDQKVIFVDDFALLDEPITAAEYFYDTDPGVGNGTSFDVPDNSGVLSQSFALSTTDLTDGQHTVHVRVQLESGSWSLYDSAQFTVDSAALDNTVTVNENTLTANFDTSGATYQWLDCENNAMPITGETERSFTATQSGSYSVRISFNGQTVISDCVVVEVTNTNDNDGDGVDNDVDNCPQTANPNQEDADNDGIGDVCDDDADNDGVTDDLDQCPNTPAGATVDFDGCPVFSFPANNFTVQTTGESCIDNNDGSISITAVQNLDYTATLVGNANTVVEQFTSSADLTSLEAGEYELCISVAGQSDYELCFDLVISQPEALSVSSKVNVVDKTLTLDLKGSGTYHIRLNNEVFRTTESKLTLPLNQIENTLSINGDYGCQGSFDEIIVVTDQISAYPNPLTTEALAIYLGSPDEFETVKASLHNLSGAKVMDLELEVNNGFAQIDFDRLPEGVYILTLKNKTTLFNHKIIKR
ncbi:MULTISPECIES: T9SS type A sorting domain-containing protein [Flavobacteriaceae]|uniref:T9SS type A sorting domain-containing protein n=1 Tax=Flavobacteriaceae TaxID=49546 RepID=UPI00149154E7|nr:MULTISPECIES: T9SS type A sorting domain-containing protein [Allomuricauda]MDC6366659.1 T9SS type A sorting domain-containing protein [Muricauda sp. AC10]